MRLRRSAFVFALAAAIGLLVFAAGAWALEPPKFDARDFSEPTDIDNKWFPLTPGTQFVYDGESDRGNGLRPARVVFTVTDVTKVINGVRTVVVWDRDFSDGQLVEEEIHFHAQDDSGNVWSFGEYPEEYENGQFIGAPATWIAGLAGALAGIHMQGKPRVGTPPYVQGVAPAIDFFNAAQVLAKHQRTCTPRRCYRNVLITDEFEPLFPEEGHVHKHYAPHVGNVFVEPAGNPEMETLTLTKVVRLRQPARAQANARTLELDRHAYQIVPDLYGQTPPAKLDGDRDDDDGRDREEDGVGQSQP